MTVATSEDHLGGVPRTLANDDEELGLTLADLVKTRRSILGWSMERMARAAKVTKQYVHQLEHGIAKNPSAFHIQRIANGLKVEAVVVLNAALRSQRENGDG